MGKEKYPKKRAYAQPRLAKFLKENNAYDLFRESCKAQQERSPKGWLARWNEDLNGAFSWAGSNEGYLYWEMLNEEFLSLSSN